MPGNSRRDIVREGEIGTYHTWSRCVQKAFLCGYDSVTGQDFDYRRLWIKSLLEYQASVFAIDVGNYTILSNHQHLIARTRPDIAATWNDEQVAWRWKLAWPTYRDGQWVREPTDEEIEEILANPQRIPKLRANLASLSWFMARWKEPIAKMANRESGTKGHYYEQRFGSREFLDDPANLCGNIYLDLNQWKAHMVKSLAESTCSAIADRLLASRQREAQQSLEKFRDSVPEGYELESWHMERLFADCFLAPISDTGPALIAPEFKVIREPELMIFWNGASCETPNQIPAAVDEETVESDEDALGDFAHDPPADDSTVAESSSSQRSSCREPSERPRPTRKIHRRLQRRRRRRASDNAFLDIPLDEYFKLAQSTVEQLIASTGRGMNADANHQLIEPDTPLSPSSCDIVRQFGIDPSLWCKLVDHFGDWFHWAVGSEPHMVERAERGGKKWLHGSRSCRDAFT